MRCDAPDCSVTDDGDLHKFMIKGMNLERFICSRHIEPFLYQTQLEHYIVEIIPQSEWRE